MRGNNFFFFFLYFTMASFLSVTMVTNKTLNQLDEVLIEELCNKAFFHLAHCKANIHYSMSGILPDSAQHFLSALNAICMNS